MNGVANSAKAVRPGQRGYSWEVMVGIFLAGLFLKATVYHARHMEGDEQIYRALVDQLSRGNGYTLQGHDILNEHFIDRERYDQPLFFHPPGGLLMFWLARSLFGADGYSHVQMFSYCVFYWSMMWLVRMLAPQLKEWAIFVFAGLVAFNPLLSHVVTNFWLDGPLLAISTLSVACFVNSARRKSLAASLLAGVLLGYASWIKLTALLVVPGAWLLALSVADATAIRRTMLLAAYFAVVAGLVQLPWELWQWRVYGTPFPTWTGKPSSTLIEMNQYVRFVTVVRTPWAYLSLLPRIMWTFVPSLLLLPFLLRQRCSRLQAIGCVMWIGFVLAVHMWLGTLGYSKVVRYVILLVPAVNLLVVLGFHKSVESLLSLRSSRTSLVMPALIALIVMMALAVGAEVYVGINCSFRTDIDAIEPLFGQPY